MIQSPYIVPTPPSGFVHKTQSFLEVFTPDGTSSWSSLIGDGMAQVSPTVILVAGVLLVLLLMMRSVKRKMRAKRAAAFPSGEDFAASVDIPPYVDTESVTAAAMDIDPDQAKARLKALWAAAKAKESNNPLYSPNTAERMAKDAIDIERIFCSGQLPKYLAKVSPDQFARYANTAETLGAEDHSNLIREAKALAIHGHSNEMKQEPRDGAAWANFRKQIANLDARLSQQNAERRLIVLADAYLSQVTHAAA